MKRPSFNSIPRSIQAILAIALVFSSASAFATTNIFTVNTAIASGNTNYDGNDIVVSNCTLTVDGSHSFSSLLVATNGVLTHSPSPGGAVSNYLYVTDEEQVLVNTNAAALDNDAVLTNTVSVTDSTGTIFYTDGRDYLVIEVGNETEVQRTINSAIPNGAIVLVNYEALLGTVPAGLNLSITGNVEVAVGGAVNVNGAGYNSGGPGAGAFTGIGGGGGAYGGNGGSSASTAVGGLPYGSFLEATNLGSGGGNGTGGGGGTGGGLIQIAAGGSVTINGLISANGASGTNYLSGGGSGGGIDITALSLNGSGMIFANGGAGDSTNGGGGGGGRIALQYSSTTFTGSMTAYGNIGSMLGTPGTIYTKLNGQNGLLVLDNGGQASATNTTLSVQNTSVNVLIRDAAGVQPPPSSPWSFGSLTVASNAFLTASPLQTLTLNAISAITVEAGGAILANGEGNGPGSGTGAGHYYGDGLYNPCGGGGYGGTGAFGSSTNATGGETYGSQSSPSGFGSGGGSDGTSIGGGGGGAISIVAGGVVQVDGIISANGQNGSVTGGGGGSGGTITLSGGTLLGSGTISANGGAGVASFGGGGGGGRILINPLASIFTGTISAYGGGGANWGGAGTVLMQVPGQDTQVILDNGGNLGTNTTLQSASSTDLIIRGGAVGVALPEVSFDNLYLNSNGWLTFLGTTTVPADSINFSIGGNATIEAGGGIMADFGGYGPGQGPGEGRTYEAAGNTILGSGAGHGGYGGNSSGNGASGGSTYDTVTEPQQAGSGGGGISPTSPGGPGGGIVRLSVSGTLEVDGMISANGGNGSGYAGGGGSGGSIWLSSATFSGAGSVTANGGSGANSLGGGGGGGMIYVSCNNNSFTGTMAAYGGGGANWGGAGTAITQVSQSNPQLVLDAGGNPGALTPLPNLSSLNVTLRNGAAGYISGGLSLGNVIVSSNSSVVVSNTSGFTITCSSLNVQAGASVIGDYNGYPADSGLGSGHYYGNSPDYPGSGGGNGGAGGNSISNLAVGGSQEGYYYDPQPGSGGGSGPPYSIGGAGGAEILITATGLMQIDGIISADGGNGSGIGGGGGAGGAIVLNCGSLAGAGVIRANGGNGAGVIGGGGGGGVISVTVTSTANQFNGTMSAYGGGGANWGGPGIIATQTVGQSVQLILDNDENSGPPTFVAVNNTSANLTLRNGALGNIGNESYSFGNLLISSNASLMVSNISSDGITCSSLNVQAGGSIIADSNGYSTGDGPGPGHSSSTAPYFPCGGGGNGGVGGNSISNLALGGSQEVSYDEPEAGSGGGSYSPYSFGGSGGGVISITTTGLMQIDGIISANGANGSGSGGGGGGAGGAIVLNCGSLAGAGVIRANGGNGANSIGGGGGGGWISITVTSTANEFTGTMSAYGGSGANWGGAGPISTQTGGQGVQIVLDSGGNSGPPTPITSTSSTTSLTVRDGAVCLVNGSLTISNVLVNSNASLVVSNLGGGYIINCASLNVAAGGSIVGDYNGSPAGSGSQPGHSSGQSPDFACGGGGNSGVGGNSISNLASGGGQIAGNSAEPGSGGGNDSPYSIGGAGGGVISITTTGLIQINGTISANGANGSGIGGGGGAGGSIVLNCGSLAGTGIIRANGGGGAITNGGGGGGGLISIIVTVTNQFNGTATAYGGSGANWGGPGLILNQTSGQGIQFLLDSGENPGAPTPITGTSSTSSLTVRNGAVGLVTTGLSLNSLLVASNGSLFISNVQASVTLTLASADIEAGGKIFADSGGFLAGEGVGPGHASQNSPNDSCSGAGHGGMGGSSLTNGVGGGSAYDEQVSPSIPGSGGGTESPYSIGGAGGGAFIITVSGLLQVDGVISANGGNGSGIGGGGGAGGSIRIIDGTLSGGGTIRANGGNGADSIGGGGAGGCIALGPNTDLFTGTISASGGGGANWGGAGTIYFQTNGEGQLILDNGGQTGALTPIGSVNSTTTALILRNGAVGYQQIYPQTFGSLLVASNGVLTASSNSGVVNLTLTGNATIEAGGGIVTDNLGSAPGTGAGAGQSPAVDSTYTPCGGGGYGGFGANSSNNTTAGGTVYGSITSPTIIGSGGGNYPTQSPGGAGGGSIHLTVNGTLDASGTISANGGNGSGRGGGGGSGGSIMLTLNTLTGTGAITANGGNGASDVGGGGGGGRIAITYNTDSFTGPITTHGGGGYAYGGAGTIYTKANSQSVGQVLVENGGAAGTNTPLSSGLGAPAVAFNLNIESNAVVCPQMNYMFPLLNSLTVSTGGLLTSVPNLTTLDVLVFGDATVASGSSIAVNGEGYGAVSGPGAGQSGDYAGSGAGYGGVGGASEYAAGGVSYGSEFQPMDFGSGGGSGLGGGVGGSAGGGAIRLNVGGVLTVTGEISAEGEAGFYESFGGGSGGSVWVDTGALVGGGLVAADGGEGQADYGGGGAGGRIALYIRTNAFFGSTSADGGAGYSAGSSGTIFTSNNVPILQVLSDSLSGTLSNGVSSLVLYFNGAPNPNSVNAGTVLLTGPDGAVAVSISISNSSTFIVSFPLETANGTYTLAVSNVVDLYGRPLSPVYNATFNLSLPVIQGAVTDSYGNPLAGVLLQPSVGSPATTDTNGNYSLGFAPGSSLTVTPSFGTLMFLPSSISYTNLSATILGQNYTGVTTIAPTLTSSVNAANFMLGLQGIAGVNYQIYCSTDLVNWLPYGAPFTGSNTPVEIPISTTNGPQMFFSIQSSY